MRCTSIGTVPNQIEFVACPAAIWIGCRNKRQPVRQLYHLIRSKPDAQFRSSIYSMMARCILVHRRSSNAIRTTELSAQKLYKTRNSKLCPTVMALNVPPNWRAFCAPPSLPFAAERGSRRCCFRSPFIALTPVSVIGQTQSHKYRSSSGIL